MVIEMPVLDNALLGCALAFTPLMVALTFGEPVMRGVQRGRARGPGARVPLLPDIAARHRAPGPGARAPPCCRACSSAASRRTAASGATFETPALVIGHRRDPVHPFTDAGMLADELPNARLLEADSILELRAAPERLTGEIARLRRRVLEAAAQAAGPRGRATRPDRNR